MQQIQRLAAVVARHLELRLTAIQAVRDERRLRGVAEARAGAAADLSDRLRLATQTHRDSVHPEVCELGGGAEACAAAPTPLRPTIDPL